MELYQPPHTDLGMRATQTVFRPVHARDVALTERRLAGPETTRAARSLLTATRPRQWLKNVLVFAAPAAAGVVHEPAVVLRLTAAFLVFSLAAASTYLVNDVRDREADRLHPTKRDRPIASGAVSVGMASVAAVLLGASSLVGAMLVAGRGFALLMLSYLVLTFAYSVWLKHRPVIDIAAISAGFVLRAVASAMAVSVHMSEWFLVVVCFAALTVATGKRFSELAVLQLGSSDHRPALAAYTPSYLRHVLFSAATVTIVAYGTWAFDHNRYVDAPWLPLSIVPLVIGLLQFGLLAENGATGAPEEVALRDRGMQLVGLAFVVLFLLGVYTR